MWTRFEQVAREHAFDLAITNEAGGMTYRVLLEQANRLRRALDGTIQPIVLIALPGGPECTLVQLATWAAGGVAALISDQSTEHETRSVLGILVPDLVVVRSLAAQKSVVGALTAPTSILTFESPAADPGQHRVVTFQEIDTMTAPAKRSGLDLPSDARLIQFTSGSTAAPKGIVLSNANLTANLDVNHAHLRQFEGKHVFSALPQFHAMGGAVVMEHLWHGSPIHVANRFVPGEDVTRMRQHACAGILASPNYVRLMCHLGALRPATLPALQSFTLGTAGVEPQLVARLHAAYPESVVYLRYGLSECVGALTLMAVRAGDDFEPGLVGPLVAGAQQAPAVPSDRIPDRELIVRSPCTAIGQLLAHDECRPVTDEEGFLHTGDIGCFDAAGRFHIRGRAGTFLKVNGHRISPFEIELVLKAIPGVQEAVVVGAPDPVHGQHIVACLEAIPGHALPDSGALDRLCRHALADYKVPRRFVVLTQMPRTHVGKPDRTRVLTEVGTP